MPLTQCDCGIYDDKNIFVVDNAGMDALTLIRSLTVGDLLFRLRKTKKIEIIPLSKRAKVNKGTISRIENDQVKHPTHVKVDQIARQLGSSAAEIYSALETLRELPSKAAPVVPFGRTEFHRDMHRKLQEILESDYAAGIRINIDAIHQYATRSAPRPPTERQKFSEDAVIHPGDIFELRDGRIITIGAIRNE